MFPNFVILIIFALPSGIAFHVLKDNSNNDSYKLCLNALVDEFFENGEFIYIISDDMDDSALLEIPQPKIILNANSTEKYSPKPSLIGYNYIIRAEEEGSLRRQLKYFIANGMLRRKLAPKCKFLVITSTADIKSIFKAMWDYLAFDVIVLVSRMLGKGNQLKWHHSDPFTVKNSCGKTPNVIQEQKCTEKVKVSVKRSFRGNEYCPVHFINTFATDINPEAAEFIFTLFRILKQQYHCNTIFKETNLSARALIGNNHRDVLDGVSQEFLIQKWVWFLPLPEKLSPLEIYIVIFQKEVWVMAFAGFAIALVFYVVISALHRLPVNMSSFVFISLEILSLTLWGSPNTSHKIRVIRLFVLCYTFYAIVIQTAYISNLIRVLTIPQYEKGIETLEELANSSLQVYISGPGAGILKKYREHHELVKKFEQKIIALGWDSSYKAVQQMIKYNNCSIMMHENRAAVFLKELSKRNITLINNKIIFDTSLFGYFAKVLSMDPIPDYYYLHHFNMIMTALKENGFYTKLDNQRSARYKEFVRAAEHSTDPQVLTMEHLYGIFVIFGFGIFIACIVFIVEKITAELSRRKNHSKVIILHALEI